MCRFVPDLDCSNAKHSESERSKPSSRNFLIGEQPNPWQLLHHQDKLSRHRGAEPCRRYGRLGTTSLFNNFLWLALDYIFTLRYFFAKRKSTGGDGVLVHSCVRNNYTLCPSSLMNINIETQFLYIRIVRPYIRCDATGQVVTGSIRLLADDFPRYYQNSKTFSGKTDFGSTVISRPYRSLTPRHRSNALV